MSGTHRVAVFVGSLRKESFARKIAAGLIEAAPPSLSCEILEIGHLSYYNQDLDEKPPADWERLRSAVRGATAVLFVTPEYNRSIPGVLKNAIDIASRPYGHNAFAGKPGAVASSSTGDIGGFGANHHLRQVLTYVDVTTMAQPELYVTRVESRLDERGGIRDEQTRKRLREFMAAFEALIVRIVGSTARVG